MGKGSYLGGSTVLGFGATKKVGKASRFSAAMMEAYKLRTMTAAERKAYLKGKARKKSITAKDKKVIASKLDVQMLPTLKPGALVSASALKAMVRKANAAAPRPKKDVT